MPDPLERWHFDIGDGLQLGDGPDAFEPRSYEEYTGEFKVLECFSPVWRPLHIIACEDAFRGFLGGEPAGSGWFYEPSSVYTRFNVKEVVLRGTGVIITSARRTESDGILCKFFNPDRPFGLDDEFDTPESKAEVLHFLAINRAMFAETLNMSLEERLIVLAGRIGSVAAPPTMLGPDQIRHLSVIDWSAGTGEFESGERVYCLHGASADDLNAARDENAGAVTLRARKAREVRTFLLAEYPGGVPLGVSNGTLTSKVIGHLKMAGFEGGISEKTIYRVRRDLAQGR